MTAQPDLLSFESSPGLGLDDDFDSSLYFVSFFDSWLSLGLDELDVERDLSVSYRAF